MFWVAPLLAVLAHARAIGNKFVYDDVLVVVAHPAIRSVRTLPDALVSPWWYQERHLYRPLALLSLGIDWIVARGQPWLPHAENVLLHAVATILVGWLAARWVPRPAALVAAVFFAVHPVHTEAVATAVGRAELLCGVMLLGVMLLASSERPFTWRTRLAMAALAAAALASKEVGAVAPALAFASAWVTPSQRRYAWRWAAAATFGVVPLLVARTIVLGTVGGDLPHPAFSVSDWNTGFRFALSMLPRSVLALALPLPAPIDVAPPLAEVMAPDLWLTVVGGVLVVAVLVVLVVHLRKPSTTSLAVWVTAATLAPTANLLFPSGVVLSGRTLYAPSIGVALLVAAAAAWVASSSVAVRRVAVGVTLSWALVAAWCSVRESVAWRDADIIGRTMLTRQPKSYRSHVYVAEVARLRGDDRSALEHYRVAVDLFPRDGHQLYSAAATALATGDTVSATDWLERAIALTPNHWMARTRAVKLALTRGDSLHARALLDEGLRRVPDQRTWRTWRQELDPPSSP